MNLLYVLPDKSRQKVLAEQHRLPAYGEAVDENVGFEHPQMFNDFFQACTGIPALRRYSFNTRDCVVFVMEQLGETQPANGCAWAVPDDLPEHREIARKACLYYNKSANMPWVNESGFAAYFTWLRSVCAQRGIRINGEITQVKNAYVSTVFLVPTNAGPLYMKIPGKLFITELPFTHALQKTKMTQLPVWLACNFDLNAILMKDMGGFDLPPQSGLDVYREVIAALANMQKASAKHLPLPCAYDHSLDAMIKNLGAFPQKAFDILQATPHAITQSDLVKLEQNIASAIKLLKPVRAVSIPNTIQHGDVRPGNIRVVGHSYMFYDWAWGAVSHPFIDASQFLHIIRRNLPVDIPAKEMLIDAYLREWLAFGTYDELKYVFTVLDDLKELFMAYVDYVWLEAIELMHSDTIDAMSADGWLRERRAYYFAKVLQRFHVP